MSTRDWLLGKIVALESELNGMRETYALTASELLKEQSKNLYKENAVETGETMARDATIRELRSLIQQKDQRISELAPQAQFKITCTTIHGLVVRLTPDYVQSSNGITHIAISRNACVDVWRLEKEESEARLTAQLESGDALG